MATVDPWGGTVQGLATLGDTFDLLEERRRRRELDARALSSHQDELDRAAREEARQSRLDELNAPYLAARNEEANISLDANRRKAVSLAEYDAARKNLEGDMSTATVPNIAETPNPNYVPPVRGTSLADIRSRNRDNALVGPRVPGSTPDLQSDLPVTDIVPATGAPTTSSVVNRPLTESEKMQQRLILAVKSGQFDELSKLSTAYDLSDKLNTEVGRKLSGVAAVIEGIRQKLGPDAAKRLAPQIAKEYGLNPELMEGINFDADGSIYRIGPYGVPYRLSPDGKTLHEFRPPAEKNEMSGVNDFTTFYRGKKDKNPNVTNAEISAEWHKQKLSENVLINASRAEGFGKTRMYSVLDTKNGNRPVMVSASDLGEANINEPGRYVASGVGDKALGRTALIEDIRGAINVTRESIKRLPKDFTATQAAQIALALNSNSPGMINSMLQSDIGKSLTPEQIDYITNLAQLKENAMAMRSVLGMGQGSEDMRAAIYATLPTARTPSKAYAAAQLDKFEQQLNRLARGVPSVPLAGDAGGASTATPSPGGGKSMKIGKYSVTVE